MRFALVVGALLVASSGVFAQESIEDTKARLANLKATIQTVVDLEDKAELQRQAQKLEDRLAELTAPKDDGLVAGADSGDLFPFGGGQGFGIFGSGGNQGWRGRPPFWFGPGGNGRVGNLGWNFANGPSPNIKFPGMSIINAGGKGYTRFGNFRIPF